MTIKSKKSKIFIYIKKVEASHLLKLYFLVSWKDYSKKKDTKKPALAV